MNLPLTSEGEAEATSWSIPPEVAPSVPVALPLLKEALEDSVSLAELHARNPFDHDSPPMRDRLRKMLWEFRLASGRWYGQPAGSGTYDAEVIAAQESIESLFRDLERDKERLEKEANDTAYLLGRAESERDEWEKIAQTNFKDFQSANDELAAVQAERDRLQKQLQELQG